MACPPRSLGQWRDAVTWHQNYKSEQKLMLVSSLESLIGVMVTGRTIMHCQVGP